MTDARGKWVKARFVLGLALLLGTVEASQGYLGRLSTANRVTFGVALAATLPSWLILAVLTPAVVWLANRYRLEQTGRARAVAAHVVAAIVFSVVHIAATSAIEWYREGVPAQFSLVLSRLLGVYFVPELLTYAAIVGAVQASHYYHEFRARELAASQLQASPAEARIRALRSQLNPHFLFNTLNAVSALALRGESRSVVRTLSSLGELLRTALDDDMPQEIALQRELKLLDRYLEIQHIRFADRLTLRMEIDPDALDALVPSMLLQPLVENALDHGVRMRRGAGTIVVGARVAGETLRLEVRDTGPGFAAPAAGARTGIGLRNTRDRLEQLYGSAQRVTCANAEGEGAVVTVEIPLRRAARDANGALFVTGETRIGATPAPAVGARG